jgi:twitching motility protein PilT
MTVAGVNVDAIESYLQEVIRRKGTDLLFTPGSPVRVRVDGRLAPIDGAPVLHASDCASMIEELLSEELHQRLLAERDVDLAFAYGDTHRFRANCYFRTGELAMSLRSIPLSVPSPAEIGIPLVLANACEAKQGFVLVTGPTGSGKSTTLASLIEYINERRPVHILTIEDPIEYTFRHRVAAIDQREVGVDAQSFAHALRSALREDPDVILVGEMRDPETIQFALTLAETGHLVFATLHTNDASQSLDRISDVFPPDQQTQIRIQLAASLAAVVSQRLLPRIGGGLVAAFELLVANDAVRNLIREGRTHQLRNVISSGGSEGMTTLDAQLKEMVMSGQVAYDDAVAQATRPKEIERRRDDRPADSGRADERPKDRRKGDRGATRVS